jgi:hypothetical protein
MRRSPKTLLVAVVGAAVGALVSLTVGAFPQTSAGTFNRGAGTIST